MNTVDYSREIDSDSLDEGDCVHTFRQADCSDSGRARIRSMLRYRGLGLDTDDRGLRVIQLDPREYEK